MLQKGLHHFHCPHCDEDLPLREEDTAFGIWTCPFCNFSVEVENLKEKVLPTKRQRK